MSEKPLLSIIVPVYKVESYLCNCIDSILNQRFSDYELILVDDGSPDKCPSICDDYARRNDKIHVYVLDMNLLQYLTLFYLIYSFSFPP